MKHLRFLIKWAGLVTMGFGAVSILWALWLILRFATGWGLSPFEQEVGDDWAKAALGLLLSGMFFFLVGSGLALLSRYEVRDQTEADPPAPRWAKPVMVLLYVGGFASIALATLFAGMTREFGEATAGIVSYCMLMGVGMLFSGWGLKRAGEREAPPGQDDRAR